VWDEEDDVWVDLVNMVEVKLLDQDVDINF